MNNIDLSAPCIHQVILCITMYNDLITYIDLTSGIIGEKIEEHTLWL